MKKAWIVALSVAVLGALAGCGGSTTAPGDLATLRAVHGVINGPSVDVTFGLDFVSEGLIPGTAGPYREVGAGTLPLNIIATGDTGTGFNTIATVPGGSTSSLYILEATENTDATIVVLPDNTADVGEARRVRAVHAIGGAGSVQIRLGAVNAPIAETSPISSLTFSNATPYTNVVTANQELIAVNPQTDEVVARSGNLDGLLGQAATLMLVSSGTPQFITFADGS